MAVVSEVVLRQVLFDAYEGFGDKRLKDLKRDAPFIVDGRGSGDYDARGQLFLWFCQILARVEAPDRIRLSFRGGVPQSKTVANWFEAHGAEKTNFGTEVLLTPENVDDLSKLAQAFSAIIKTRYEVSAYKYVVPRVATSVLKLKGVLSQAWS